MKTVAVYDHLATDQSGSHHLAFAKLFCKYLIQLDYRVILVSAGAGREVEASLNLEDRFSFYDISYSKPSPTFITSKFKDAQLAFGHWNMLRRHIKETEVALDETVDHVFVAWLDSFIANYLPYQLIDSYFPYEWSGLYFHPWYLFDTDATRNTISSKDYVLKSRKCTGIAIHDEFLLSKLAARIPNPVVLFPEIADGTDPATFSVTATMQQSAKGRTIVSLIGIRRRKGLLHFVDLINEAEPEQFFFVLIGPLMEEEFCSDELRLVKSVMEKSNVLHHPSYVNEGGEVNAVVTTSDVLFVVYEDFKSSSNFNTKAAIFKRPVLATEKYWIGAVTKKYQLGVTVKEGDAEDMHRGLLELMKQLDEKSFNPDFEGYLEVHREEALRKAFKELIEPENIV